MPPGFLLSTTFIVLNWILSQFLAVKSEIVADVKGRGQLQKLYSTEYHFSEVVRKLDFFPAINQNKAAVRRPSRPIPVRVNT
jgi:hypothetical protein